LVPFSSLSLPNSFPTSPSLPFTSARESQIAREVATFVISSSGEIHNEECTLSLAERLDATEWKNVPEAPSRRSASWTKSRVTAQKSLGSR
jgi:hypothetical protein